MFGVLIAAHEGGHFSVSKLFHIKVNEFSIGMGPTLWRREKGETTYSLRALPFGGFCAIEGEDGSSDDPRAFTKKPLWQRICVLAAGSGANLLIGFLIALCLYLGYCAAGDYMVPTATLDGFMEGCPYDSADGLQVGDRFLRINGHRIDMYSDVIRYLDGDGDYDLEVERDGETVRLENFRLERKDYADGRFFGFRFGLMEKAGLWQNLRASWEQTTDYVKLVWESLGMLLSGKAGVNDLAGPVGIVDLMAESSAQQETLRAGLEVIFTFGAFIAVNLAVMNMLPIPALDGGRVFLLLVTALIETITRKKIDPKYEGYIHAAGMVLLLALMGYVLLHDIFRLVRA